MRAISAKHLALMEASLANDEASSDEELQAFFVAQGIAPASAAAAVATRPEFLACPLPAPGLLADLLRRPCIAAQAR